MKKVMLAIGFALAGFLSSQAESQTVSLTIDETQSTTDIVIDGNLGSSQLSGSITLDLQSSGPPSGNAQITELDIVLEDALNFNLAPLGIVRVETEAGAVSISMVTPGPPGTIAAGSFDQLANLTMFNGSLDLIDPLGLAGGSQAIDLSTVELSAIDFNSINVTQAGDEITVSGALTISEMLDFGAGGIPIEVDLTFVATGVLPDVLLGDVSLDGTVNFLDIAPFIAVLSAQGFQAEADIDGNGVVNFLDIQPFIDILSQ